MKIDLLLIPMGARWVDLRAAALAAEEAGFDGLWTWDHLRDPAGDGGPVPEAWTVLTALAEVTRRVALGPLVLNVANRQPGVLANMAATLQAVSGGRLLLGLGAGGNRRTPYAAEQAALGQPVEPDTVRAQRVVDAIAAIRRFWSGDAGFLRPEPAPPPIVVGGFGPRMAAVAGRHGDGFNTQAFHPQLADLVRHAREAHAAAGRDGAAFVVTVFAGLEMPWLRADSRARQRLDQLGVDRLILLVAPPFDTGAIREAGRVVSETRSPGA